MEKGNFQRIDVKSFLTDSDANRNYKFKMLIQLDKNSYTVIKTVELFMNRFFDVALIIYFRLVT